MKGKGEKLIEILGPSRVKRDEPLSFYSTFKIGGPAQFFYPAKNTDELIKAFRIAKSDGLPVRLIGGATNLVIADSKVAGLVIKNESNGIRLKGISGKIAHGKETKQVVVEADSGVIVNHLVRYTIDQGLAGLEHFLGQPGTVGGAMYINAHNMNQAVFFGDKVIEATLLTPSGEVQTVPREYFRFGYDESIIQKTTDVVLSVKIGFLQGDKKDLWQKAQAALEYRQRTQPLGIPSSGCIFRNFARYDAIRLHTPQLTTSVGYLLDQLGLKGYRIGGAMFSAKHANFILNVDHAVSQDVLALIKLAKQQVKKKFDISLREEVVLLE